MEMTARGSKSVAVCVIALVASSCVVRHVELPARLPGYTAPTETPEALRGPVEYNPPDSIPEAIEVRGAVLTLTTSGSTMQVGRGLFVNPALADYELRFIKRAVAVSEDQAAELLRAVDEGSDALARRDEIEEIMLDVINSNEEIQPWWAWLGEGVAAGLLLSVLLVVMP